VSSDISALFGSVLISSGACMKKTMLFGLTATLSLGAVGCGHDCQDTCRHIYDPSECNIVKPGASAESLLNDCISECETAMDNNGELGDYTPYSHSPAFENLTLENEKQAALWIECVWDAAPDDGPSAGCQDLDPATGICAPI